MLTKPNAHPRIRQDILGPIRPQSLRPEIPHRVEATAQGLKPPKSWVIIAMKRTEIAMPELSRFYGIIVKLIYKDNEQHTNLTCT
jgi:hypothetical protein